MQLIFAFGILLLTPAAMMILHWAIPRFKLQWLIAVAGTLVTWLLVILTRSPNAQSILLMDWQQALNLPSPEILLDTISWPFAVVVTTITLSVLLTSVTRQREVENWSTWGGSLAIGAFGLVAVLAGNPITILLGWTALDLIELAILVSQENLSVIRQRIIINFASRQMGVVVLLIAVIACQSAGLPFTFGAIPNQYNLLILLAAGLRLGIFPLQPLILSDSTLQRGLGTSLRLASSASSLVLLSRSAVPGIPPSLAPYLLIITALVAILSSISWLTSDNEILGRSFWILGCASLALISAIRGQPAASLSWGVACLLTGSSLMLYGIRHRFLLILPLVSLILFAGLPFTPTWSGLDLYLSGSNLKFPVLDWIINVFIFLSHMILLAGYLRHTTRPVSGQAGPERWIWIIYPLGLALIPIMMVYTSIFYLPALNLIPFWKWGAGAVSILLTILLWNAIFRRERPEVQPDAGSGSKIYGATMWGELLSLRWLRQIALSIIHSIEFVLRLISRVLEGQAGILWTFVFLIIIFFFILPIGVGK
jgi:hypothetical protein